MEGQRERDRIDDEKCGENVGENPSSQMNGIFHKKEKKKNKNSS